MVRGKYQASGRWAGIQGRTGIFRQSSGRSYRWTSVAHRCGWWKENYTPSGDGGEAIVGEIDHLRAGGGDLGGGGRGIREIIAEGTSSNLT